ncbi:MAG: L,D-transpeptidase [Actinomycetia bacterium]|nr:L,D-transpeptidase [Actinomycetes bacterium]
MRIGPVVVGGMDAAKAEAVVRAAYDRPLRFVFGGQRWQASPGQLGARPAVRNAIRRALRAEPWQAVVLRVRTKDEPVRGYVRRLVRILWHPTLNARVVPAGSRLAASGSRTSVVVDAAATADAILAGLGGFNRTPIQFVHRRVKPRVVESSRVPAIVVWRESRELFFYRGGSLVRWFTVAVGRTEHPTPLGRFLIASKQVDPTWYPPDSEWAEGLEPVEPGPGNPLGTRWLGLTSPEIGIHGTYETGSLGTAASHGCVRMGIPEVEWLFSQVEVGTPVWIIEA